MPTHRTKTPATISTIGIDFGTTFHLVGADRHGAIVSQQNVPRGQLDYRLANCLIGMEVCSDTTHQSTG
jgi:hypothetical protein